MQTTYGLNNNSRSQQKKSNTSHTELELKWEVCVHLRAIDSKGQASLFWF
jgi:hypothetical protein